MLRTLSKEFSRPAISLRCREDEENLFTKSQWSESRKGFMIYRLLIWLYQLCWSSSYLIHLRLHHPDRLNRVHRFFTSWGDAINNIYYSSALALCIITACHKKSKLQENGTVKNMRSITWFLHTIAINSSVVVALMFWMFVSTKFDDGKLRNVFNIHRHAISSFVMLMDFCIVATPVRVLHVVYSYLYGALYTFGTLVMYWSGDTSHVYPFLNWENHPGTAALVSIIVAGVAPTILQIIFYALHMTKVHVARRCCTVNDNNNVGYIRRIPGKESSIGVENF